MTATPTGTPDQPRPDDDRAIRPGEGTEIDRLIGGPESAHPGQSGFRLVSHGPEALALRARSALLAERSLDVQTYIWHADLTGMYLAHRALEAADRGVQVRLLVDDMDARAKNQGFAGLDAHPRIEVRMFNPFESRSGLVSKLLEIVGRFPRLNRRMHNKTWIADNRIAVVGGRNLGDEYFGGADEVNFFDLDFAMVGPVVRQASDSFDLYWNSSVVRSMRELAPERVNDDELRRVRKILADGVEEVEASPFATVVRADDAVQRVAAGDWPMEWTDSWRFVSDHPEKVIRDGQHDEASRVIEVLMHAAENARESLMAISPYFVPGEVGTEVLLKTAGRGCRVEVLTNSLVANDVAAVHGGYSRYRPRLLGGGIGLWELKPMAGQRVPSHRVTTTGASLHTKALAVDGSTLFVGSYNLDPRSRLLNCEQGIMVESAALTQELETIFNEQTSGSHAWQVRLESGGQLEWSDGRDTFRGEPKAPLSRKLQAWLARVLPVEAQL